MAEKGCAGGEATAVLRVCVASRSGACADAVPGRAEMVASPLRDSNVVVTMPMVDVVEGDIIIQEPWFGVVEARLIINVSEFVFSQEAAALYRAGLGELHDLERRSQVIALVADV